MTPTGTLIIRIPVDRSRECTHENDPTRDSSRARHPEAAWGLGAARRAGSGERPVKSPEATASARKDYAKGDRHDPTRHDDRTRPRNLGWNGRYEARGRRLPCFKR